MIGRRDWIVSVLVAALLMAGFALKGALIAPPAPPAQSQPGEFDTSRAIARLQRILGDQRPHPVDSIADDEVRARLMAELGAIGLKPEVHEALDCSALPRSRFVSCSRVRNVLAMVPARAPGRAVLMDAHYDSTPTGPGAADDGLGVATLLEVGSILKAAPPPRPVLLLFNEGEEFGLNGSSAFVRTDPLSRQVDSLINIDARGVSGPALMFETSEPNGAAMSLYGRAARRPYANSLSTDFARLIPNTTDAVEFKPMHWPLLNYGIIGNETRYHSPGDTVAALDRSTVYHVGSEVLTAAQAFAAEPNPAGLGSGQRVFTDIAGRMFVSLSLPVAALLLALLLTAASYLAWREKALKRPLLISAGMVVAGIAAAGIVGLAVTILRAGDFWRAHPLVVYLGIYAALLAAMAAVWARWDPRIGRARMRAAAWLLILIFGAALSLAVPGAMIFFLFAPAVALAGLVVSSRSPRAGTILAVIATAIQFLIFAQLLALVEMLLIDGPLWAVAPFAALAALPALIELEGKQQLRPALSLLIVASVAFLAEALFLPRSSAERPGAFAIDYFRDASNKTAKWGIASKQAPLPNGFPGDWHRGLLPYNGRTRWIAPAPLINTPTPGARLIASEPEGNGRRVRVALSPGGGNSISIRFAEGTKLLAAGLPGAPETIPPKGEPHKAVVRCTGRSCEGFVVELLLGDRAPIEAELFATRFGLPPEGDRLVAARPRNAIPQYSPDQSVTMTRVRL